MNSNTSRLAEFDDFYKTKLKVKLFHDNETQPECIKNIIKRFDSMIDYNVPHGKKLRGLCVYESFCVLTNEINDKSAVNSELLDQAIAIGWCIEFVSKKTFFLFF